MASGPPRFRTRFRIQGRTLVVDLGAPRRIVSSSVRGGGVVRSRYVLNHQVPAHPIGGPTVGRRTWPEPSRYLGRVAARLGIDSRCVGLMTAVSLTQLVRVRGVASGLWIEAFVTLGLSNAVRAGEWPSGQPHRAEHAGTINLIVVTNASLHAAAMVGAVQVATECKAAVLLAEGISTWTGRPGATGTGTDATVVVSGNGRRVRYTGTHTQFGTLLGKVVSQGIRRGLGRWRMWQTGRAAINLGHGHRQRLDRPMPGR